MKIKYSGQAFRDLKSFNLAGRQLIAGKIHYLADNLEVLKKSKRVTELRGIKF